MRRKQSPFQWLAQFLYCTALNSEYTVEVDGPITFTVYRRAFGPIYLYADNDGYCEANVFVMLFGRTVFGACTNQTENWKPA